MNINYIPCGDYLIPDVAIAMETKFLGKYGSMRHNYLREHRPDLYQQLVLSSNLRSHLMEIDQACWDRMERIVPQMAEAEGVDEQLKALDQLGWISRMNNIRQRAEETILNELVFD